MDNKTIIISCAGVGSRLGRGIPKCLVEVDGKSLIERVLTDESMMKQTDIRVVVGFMKKAVMDKVKSIRPDVTFVHNDNYLGTKTGGSISLALKNSREYVLTVDGDVIFHPESLKKMLDADYEYVCGTEIETTGPVIMHIEDGNVMSFSRDFGEYEWTGSACLKRDNFKLGDGHAYQMFESNLPKKFMFIESREIDTEEDFIVAENWVKNGYKS